MRKEWIAVTIVLVVGATLISGISSLGNGLRFGPTLVYALVGLAAVSVAMAGTLVAYSELVRRGRIEESDGGAVVAWFFGMFVIAPIALIVAFRVLRLSP